MDIAIKFQERWNFPNVVGCIDGKDSHIKCLSEAGSLFYNHTQFLSMVFQGVADSESTFVSIEKGAYGKQSDGDTFSAFTCCPFFEDFESTLPKSASFEGSGTEVPFVILGEEAYLLKTYLMKPFVRKDLSSEERVFNYRQSRGRRCVACAFGTLTAKLRFLNKTVIQKFKDRDI